MERKEVRESSWTIEYCIHILQCVQGRVLGQVNHVCTTGGKESTGEREHPECCEHSTLGKERGRGKYS